MSALVGPTLNLCVPSNVGNFHIRRGTVSLPRENVMHGVGACCLTVVVRETLLEINIRNVFVLNCKVFTLFHVCFYCFDVPALHISSLCRYVHTHVLSRSCSAHFITFRCLILSYYLNFILITRKIF